MNKDEIIAELEEQLKEAKTQFDIYRSLTIQRQLDSEVVNIIRHEICEKIRDFMTQDGCLTKEELIECSESFTAKSIFQLLDQIEKGEQK